MPPRSKKCLVRRPEQVRALAGPLPLRLIAAAERLGPCTVNDLAAAIDEPAESLYYHVRRLTRVGLLRYGSRRGSGRHAEATYELPGSELVFDHRRTDRAFLAALGRSVGTLLRLAERTWRAALGRADARRVGARRNQMIQQHYARLGARDLAELNRRLEDLAAFIRDRDRPEARQWISLTMVMSPLVKPSATP